MTDLRGMTNIGAVVASELERAGVPDAETLRAAGSVNAALRLRAAGFDVCRSKLAGLEGAIRGVTWHRIPSEERAALWDELESAFGQREARSASRPRPATA